MIILFIFGYLANALVLAFTEAQGKPLKPVIHCIVVVVVTALLIAAMELWARGCPSSNEELTSPNGETSSEHYEPRF